MHWATLLVTMAVFISGCASNKDKTQATAFADTAAKPEKKPQPANDKKAVARTPTKPKKEKPAKTPDIVPSNTMMGRVATVNENLRFVVLDFLPGQLPKVDSRMNIYRGGTKVGEVKVTGPARDTNIAADISEGEAKPGDEVRSE